MPSIFEAQKLYIAVIQAMFISRNVQNKALSTMNMPLEYYLFVN
jgi:hypothetical protein